jgi:hypothetical protein
MPIANKLPARSGAVLPRAASRAAHRRPGARPETTNTPQEGPGSVVAPDHGAAPDSTARGVVSDLGTAHCCPNCGHTISVITLIVALDDERAEQPERADG